MDKLAEAALNQRIADLEAQNAALKAQEARKVTLKVSEKGAVSVYGMGRFPVTLYQEQWLKLLGMDVEVKAFITLHQDKLERKDDDDATKAQKAIKRAAYRGVTASNPPAAPGKPLVPPTTVAQPPVKRYSSRG